MNTQFRKNLKDVMTACKNYTDKKIDDLKWELGSHTLDVESDTTTAYTKTVPSGAIGCHINKVGGMSYKTTNLYDYGTTVTDYIMPISGQVFNSVGDNFLKLNTLISGGTIVYRNKNIYGSGNYNISYNNVVSDSNLVSASRVYLKCFDSQGNVLDGNSVSISGFIYNSVYSGFYNSNLAINTFVSLNLTIPNNVAYWVIGFGATASVTNENITFTNIMINEGSTALPYQPYFEGIRDSAVTSLVSKDSNNTTLDTYTIPAEVQALEGYGWGVNDTCYNYIDFETKKFIKKVGKVDLGSLNGWTHTTSGTREIFRVDLPNAKGYEGEGTIIKCLSDRYIPTTREETWVDMNIAYNNNVIGSRNVAIVNNKYTTVEAFKTAMSGVYLYYELGTPVETDISAYIEDGTIVIEPNGTIIFTNTYNQAVPSEIDYLIEEVKA